MFASVMVRFAVLILLLSQLAVSCTNNDRNVERKMENPADFLNCSVDGDEESGFMTVKVQYMEGGAQGMAIEIPEAAIVTLDGRELPRASTKRNGVYYELSIPVDSFAGKHVLEISAFAGSKLKQEFEFKPFRQAVAIEDSIHRGELNFQFADLPNNVSLQVILTDTSFYSKGIDTLLAVSDGRISLTPGTLTNLRKGPIQLEFHQEKLHFLERGAGVLMVSYAIRRGFYLID